MIYELRIYTATPGRLPDILARFRDHTLKIWERYGIRQAGFWTTLVGPDSSTLTYFLAWESLAEREAKWNAFIVDPEWLAVRAASEKDSRLNGWPAGTPVNASSRTSRCVTHDSGPAWLAIPLLLRTFTFYSLRSLPAH